MPIGQKDTSFCEWSEKLQGAVFKILLLKKCFEEVALLLNVLILTLVAF